MAKAGLISDKNLFSSLGTFFAITAIFMLMTRSPLEEPYRGDYSCGDNCQDPSINKIAYEDIF